MLILPASALSQRTVSVFHDLLGGLSTVDHIAQMTTVKGIESGGRLSNKVAVNDQRIINLRFIGRRPDDSNPDDRSSPPQRVPRP
ncbi:MAG: hypothetical protein ABI625_08370 [bacterium]